MALFARICVLRGLPAAAYRKYASPKTRYASPVKCEAYLTGGLDPDKNCSFMNWKRNVPLRIYTI